MTNPMEIYERLKSAMPEAQASAVVQAIRMAFADDDSGHSNRLANKVDQAKFDAEMHQLEENLNRSIADHAARISESFARQLAKTNESIAAQAAGTAESFAGTDEKIAEYMARTDEKITQCMARTDGIIAIHAAQTDAKIAQSKAEMIRWMFVFWIGQIAAMKFLR